MDDVQTPSMIDVDPLYISTKHHSLVDKHLGDDLDELTLILKSHLLIEELLHDFCDSFVGRPKYLRDARLTFKQTLNLARSIYTLDAPRLEWTWGAVGCLNTMRNLMAHAIEPDEKKYASAKEVIVKGVMAHTHLPPTEIPTFQGAIEYLYGVFSGQLEAFLILAARGTAAQMPISPTPSTTSEA
jgi:hypothetical protein